MSVDAPELDLETLGRGLRFPYKSARRGQDLMLRDLDGALENGLTLLCSAPTGIGKTLAALYPALARAVTEDRRVYFVTAKNSQQILALETLQEILPDEPDHGAVQIAAREKLCPFDGKRCSEERCSLADAVPERLDRSGLLDELRRHRVLSASMLRAAALDRRMCPFEVTLCVAEHARALVGDFNHVFHPRAYLRRLLDAPHDRDFLIVDEAHNLPARAIEYYSPSLSHPLLEEAARACLARTESGPLAAGLLLQELGQRFERAYQTLSEERESPGPHVDAADDPWFHELEERASEALAAYTAYRVAGGQAILPASVARRRAHGIRELDPILETLGGAKDFALHSMRDSERFAILRAKDATRLRCLDPAPELSASSDAFAAAVFMSATLTPLDYYQRALGLGGPRGLLLDLPSPFPRANRFLGAVTSVDTRFKNRSEYAATIARQIAEVIALRPGNYLAFFSSYAYRDEVVAKLPRGAARVLLQLPGIPAETTLGLLKAGSSDTRLLCAVQGGVFSEGVDYPGEMAIGVFVVGPGLPAPSPEQELVRAYHERELGQGFEFAYLHPGLGRAVQAGGRAIRTETDQAFTLLMDRRFAEKRYLERLPRYWREELEIVQDPAPAVRAFWARCQS